MTRERRVHGVTRRAVDPDADRPEPGREGRRDGSLAPVRDRDDRDADVGEGVAQSGGHGIPDLRRRQ